MDMIERELMADWNATMYPSPEPTEVVPETYSKQKTEQMMAASNINPVENEQAGFGEVSLGQFTRGVADTSAGLLKGAVQGFVGLPGDLEEIGRLLVNLAGGEVNEEAYLATTDDIKKIIDRYAPLKAEMGERQQKITETVGEFASPGGYLKGVKAATKSATARKAGKRVVAAGGASATIKQSQQEPN